MNELIDQEQSIRIISKELRRSKSHDHSIKKLDVDEFKIRSCNISKMSESVLLIERSEIQAYYQKVNEETLPLRSSREKPIPTTGEII